MPSVLLLSNSSERDCDLIEDHAPGSSADRLLLMGLLVYALCCDTNGTEDIKGFLSLTVYR